MPKLIYNGPAASFRPRKGASSAERNGDAFTLSVAAMRDAERRGHRFTLVDEPKPQAKAKGAKATAKGVKTIESKSGAEPAEGQGEVTSGDHPDD